MRLYPEALEVTQDIRIMQASLGLTGLVSMTTGECPHRWATTGSITDFLDWTLT